MKIKKFQKIILVKNKIRPLLKTQEKDFQNWRLERGIVFYVMASGGLKCHLTQFEEEEYN